MAKSYRSTLTAMLREASAACGQALQSGASIDEVTAMRGEFAPARRRVLLGAAAAAASVMIPRRSLAIGQPRVVIVGAGAAGLSCAYRLWNTRGISSTIYEWNTRIGGRIQTLRNYFANGQTAEQHAEFISSEHTQTMRLAHDFGLTFENTFADPPGVKDTYWFDGARYTQKQLNQDWQEFGWQLFRDAVEKAPAANYKHYTDTAYKWDHMSVSEWVDRHVPGGRSSAFGKLCHSVALDEYGCHPDNQSALNLIFTLGFDASTKSGYQPKDVPVLGGSDEKWHIKGGTDQLTDALAAKLPAGTIRLGHQLVAVREKSDGSYACHFYNGTLTKEVTADHVVLTLPFTTLRQVDLSGVKISPLKRTAIKWLPLGKNAKIQIQVAGRPWVKDGFDGFVLTGSPMDGGWDSTSYQNGGKASPTEIFVALPGGADGEAMAAKYGLQFGHEQGPASASMVSDTLVQLEPIYPGVTSAWINGPKLAWYNDGNIDERLLGAWSQYNVGQYTGFSGIEAVAEGNIHFAGEHTDPNYQGYVEGALRSGLRAADEI